MSALAALCGRTVRTWLCTQETASRQLIPEPLMALQAAVATLIHVMELTEQMGIPTRCVMRDFIAHLLEDSFQLGGALVTGDRRFWVAARVDAADIEASTWQRAQFKSDVTGFCRDLSSWLTAQLPHHRAEARRLLENFNALIDKSTDGTFQDPSLDELRRQIADVIPTFERLMDSGLPTEWDGRDAGWGRDDGWEQSNSSRAWNW